MQPTVNLFDPEVRANPYPSYARMRLGAPIQQVQPGGFWAVSRAEDIEYVLKRPEVFASGFEPFFKPDWLPHNPIGDSLITKDGPAHARLRALVSRAFTPRAIGRLEPRIQAICEEVVAHLAEVRECDFIDALCARIPGLVIADIIGLDRGLFSQFKRWVGHLAIVSPIYPGDEVADAVRATIREMEDLFREVVAAHRREERDDLVNDLIAAELDGRALTDEEIMSFLFAILAAGFETTMHFFSNAMIDFDQRPDAFTHLREHRESIPAYVEELLRKKSPVHSIFRLTAVETELCGVHLPPGTMVMLLLASGNHDEALVAKLEAANAQSANQAGFTFGHGIHHCLGAALARLEARLALEALADRFVRFEKLPGEIEWNLLLHVRGPVALPFRAILANEA